jgi:hypothetical protein
MADFRRPATADEGVLFGGHVSGRAPNGRREYTLIEVCNSIHWVDRITYARVSSCVSLDAEHTMRG